MGQKIKLVLISLVILFIVTIAITSLLPSHIRISRAIDIRATERKVQTYLNDLQRWKEWNGFVSIDSSLDEKAGEIKSGDLKIFMASSKPDTLFTLWMNKNGKKYSCNFSLLKSDSGLTTVQWYFDFHLKWYPWEKLGSIVYDKELGKIMEPSLSKLKKIIETSQ